MTHCGRNAPPKKMIDLAGYSFDDHKACIVYRHVLDGLPVLGFAHDGEGDLPFHLRKP
jgi:hypothetical protein